MFVRSLPRSSRGFAVAQMLFSTKPADIDAGRLTVKKNSSPKPKQAKETLKFGTTFTDHMLEVDWEKDGGWKAPAIIPYGNLSLSPAASSLHYALQCFEGMKAYVDDQNQIRMFRPDKNMARLNSSATRLLLPNFNGDQFLACIKELLKIDKDWIPRGMGYSLYIRPTLISTFPYVGVAAPQSAKLFVILSPVGPYYPSGFAPVKLLADPKQVRAWPGGTGNIKCGGNYALGIKPGMEANAQGYAQCLWLFGEDQQVTEVGTMNIFFFMKNKQGKPELVTAPLDGTILPGVTRDSVLSLARTWGEFEVSERPYTIHEIIAAVKEKRMIEAFGAGTAAIVSPVNGFRFGDQEYSIPLNPTDSKKQAGALTLRIADTIMGIQYGKIDHPWSVVVK